MSDREPSEPVPGSRLSRRRFVTLFGSATIAAGFLAACGGDDDAGATPSATTAATGTSTPAGTSPATETATATTAGSAAAFPVTIEHEFGSTTIERPPQRIVAAGFNEVDFVLAFGVVPVGQRDFIGTYPEDTRPWAVELVEGQEITVIGGTEIDFELVASLNPDLILGVYAFLEQGAYDNLNAIAPTVAGPAGGATWQEQTRLTGLALGQPEQAEALVAAADERFGTVLTEYPQFEGKTLAIVWGTGDPGSGYYLLPPTDLRAQFFYNMGFVPPETTGELSAEEAQLIDQDLIAVFGWSEEDVANDSLFQGLTAVQEGRVIHFAWESDLAGALGFSSPLSIPYAIDLAAPQLAAALEGAA